MPPQHNIDVLAEDTDDDACELLQVVRQSHPVSQSLSTGSHSADTTACAVARPDGENVASKIPVHGAGKSVKTDPLFVAEHVQAGLSKLDEFRAMLDNAVPIAFAPSTLVQFIRKESILRLQKAREDKIPLSELTIGQDCLPTWPSLGWELEEETLHSVIQSRLIDYEASQGLGNLVRERLITVANTRIQTAREAGLTVQAVSIGPDLLPVWDIPDRPGHHGEAEEIFSPVENHKSQSTQMSRDPLLTPSSVTDISPITEIFDIGAPASDVALSPMTSCDSDSDVVVTDGEPAGPRSLVAATATYEEYDGELTNVAGVDVVGGPKRCASVDLEVYLAEDDDDDFDGLPVVELAINGDAFVSWFGEQGVVDVELPRAGMFCFDGIEDADDGGEAAEVDSSDDGESY